MPSIILTPAAAAATGLSVVPALRPNWECVSAYPDNLGIDSYVYIVNNTGNDFYQRTVIPSNLLISIHYLSVTARCKAENAAAACTAEPGINIIATTSYGDIVTLTTSWQDISHYWYVNPHTVNFWSLTEPTFPASYIGIRLASAAAGTEAQCTQVYGSIYFEIIGEVVTNFFPFYHDSIHIGHAFSVFAQEDNGRPLYNTTTRQIAYRSPDGATGVLNAAIVDSNKLLCTIPAALNNQLGKWHFQLLAVNIGGMSETYRGKPFFVNVCSQWT